MASQPDRAARPLVALLALLICSAWFIGFAMTLISRQQDILGAKTAYALALAETRTNLAMQLSHVTGDSSLVQNLAWKLNHSVASGLTGRLARGQLDQINVFDQNCADLGHAALGKTLALDCPFTNGKASSDAFVSFDHDGVQGLVLQRPLTGRTDAVAVGLVQIDESWLALHPELKAVVGALGLKLGGDGFVVVQPPTTSGAAPTLTSVSLLDRILHSRMESVLTGGLLWALLAGCFLLAVIGLWRHRHATAASQSDYADFSAWCRSLLPDGQIALAGRTRAMTQELASRSLHDLKQVITQALRLRSDAMLDAQEHGQNLETQIKGQDDVLKRQGQRLAELAELDSLAVQLQRTSAIFLEKMDDLHDQAEDLRTLSRRELAVNSQTLANLAGTWQQGIAQRGARKFVRGLSETASDVPDQTQLDDQLRTMVGLAQGICDQSLGAAQLASSICERSVFASRVAGLWHGLALRSPEAAAATTLVTPVKQAQELLGMEQGFASVTFSNLVDEPTMPLPSMPETIWVSALYHLYLAMAKLTLHSATTVVSRLRRDGDKINFIIQISGTNTNTLPQRSEAQAYHMEIARAILAPFHVTLAALPALEGPFPLSLSWQLQPEAPTPLPKLTAKIPGAKRERSGGEALV